VQFYNQGTTEYTTCAGLLTTSSSKWPNTAVFQLAAGGVALNKIVIGKPGNSYASYICSMFTVHSPSAAVEATPITATSLRRPLLSVFSKRRVRDGLVYVHPW
jgi:hypothetical protein